MEIEHKRGSAEPQQVETRCALHPERIAVGTCGRCGNYYCNACSGWREEGEQHCKACGESRSYVAWEDRSLGLWERYYRTIRMSVVALPRFAAELPAQGSLRLALTFAVLPTSVSAMLVAAFMSVLLGFVTSSIRVASIQGPAALALGGIMFVTYTLMGLFAYVAYLLAWPLLMLLTARLLGRRQLTYRGALRCLCYASGFNWLYCIPLVNMGVAVYHFVVASFCGGAMSRGSWLTGFAIYGVPTMLCSMGACGTYFALIFTALGTQH